MSILSNNQKGGKKGSKSAKKNAPGFQNTAKPGKTVNMMKKPPKTGGTRGS